MLVISNASFLPRRWPVPAIALGLMSISQIPENILLRDLYLGKNQNPNQPLGLPEKEGTRLASGFFYSAHIIEHLVYVRQQLLGMVGEHNLHGTCSSSLGTNRLQRSP